MTGKTQPQTISLLSLADRFIEDHARMSNRAFAFVLGAGASRSSGIKGASQMVDDWVRSLHREATGEADGEDGKGWASAGTLGIAHYDPADPASCYSELYRRMYARDPDRGYAYLEEQMRKSEPSYGYSVLARIMDDTRHKVVVTTNFDNLVADALSIFGRTYPLVCGHESLAGFISARARRPLVVKVHRDLLLAPKSAPEDLSGLPDGFKQALAQLFGHYTPIVIGYGGNDGSLMTFLESLPERSVPGGVYWCYWDAGPPPSDAIQRFVAAQNGCLVPIPSFDEAMLLLGNALEYDVPDKYVLERAAVRAKRIVEQVQALNARMKANQPRPTGDVLILERRMPDITATAPDPNRDPGENMSKEAASNTAPAEDEALAQAMKKTMQRQSGPLRWWQWEEKANAEPDVEERDRIYQEAIAALPESDELLGNYAIFLDDVLKDYGKAEKYYLRALEILPDALNLCNYGVFQKNFHKDFNKAEEYYLRSLDIDPNDFDTLGNYAALLFEMDRTDAGLHYVERAILLSGYDTPSAVTVELWMYATCHWLPERWREGLAKLKALLVKEKLSSGDWDFSGVIKAAKKRGHPAADWLEPLAAVCNGTADASTLLGWEDWAQT